MRHSLLLSLLSTFLATSIIQQTYALESPVQVNSVWRGTYSCVQGETELELKIIENQDNSDIQAVFEFFYKLANTKGSFSMRGKFNPEDRTFNLRADKWISRPLNWETVDMEGKISRDLKSYTGTVIFRGLIGGCGDFKLKASPKTAKAP